MKYKVHIRFDIEIEAESNLSAIEAAEKIMFEGNTAHKAQPFLTYLECIKQRD